MKKDSINIRLENNTSTRVPVQIMGGKGSTDNNVNQNDLVSWDLSSEDFARNTLFLTTTPEYVKILRSDEENIQGVVNALNTFGVATFYREGSIIYAVDILNETVKTALIELENRAYDIDGWNDILSQGISDNYVTTMRNARFSSSGLFLIIGDSSLNESNKIIVGSSFIPSTIGLIDQVELGFSNFQFYSEDGLFRYSKADASDIWNRQELTSAFDLTTVQPIDETVSVAFGNCIVLADSGTKFYGFNGSTIAQFSASTPYSLMTLTSTGTIDTDLISGISGDGLVLGYLQLSPDGSRAFILRQGIADPITAIIYQLDLSIPFDITTAVYNGISVTLNNFNTDQPFTDFQFNTDGRRFVTAQDDGLSIQQFQIYG